MEKPRKKGCLCQDYNVSVVDGKSLCSNCGKAKGSELYNQACDDWEAYLASVSRLPEKKCLMERGTEFELEYSRNGWNKLYDIASALLAKKDARIEYLESGLRKIKEMAGKFEGTYFNVSDIYNIAKEYLVYEEAIKDLGLGEK